MPPRLFELDGQWIARDSRSRFLYRHWYEPASGRIRRRSLGVEDIEQAKRKLAEIVVTGAAARREQAPDAVLLVTVLDHYLTHKVPEHKNRFNAEWACQLLAEFLFTHRKMKASLRADAFSLALQQDFMEWCATEKGHKATAIERNMVSIRAAFNFAAQSQMVTIDGQRREVRLMTHAPTVKTSARWIAQNTSAIETSGRGEWVPEYDMLADLLDQPAADYVQRYDIIALNTWARPEAIWELNTVTQADHARGLLDMNPPGRKQTNKYRPLIRLTEGLAQWIKVWDRHYPLQGRTATFTGCARLSGLSTAFERRTDMWRMMKAGYSDADYRAMLANTRRKDLDREARWKDYRAALDEAQALGFGQVTMYTLRHFMATKVRSLTEVRVSREQRKAWLGHARQDTTSWYEASDPEFLADVALATDIIIGRLDHLLTTRRLLPRSVRQKGLKVVGGTGA